MVVGGNQLTIRGDPPQLSRNGSEQGPGHAKPRRIKTKQANGLEEGEREMAWRQRCEGSD